MFKMVTLLVRPDGWSHDEFRDYWETEHAPLVDDLPGVQKYATSVPTDPGRAPYDGVAELYFEDFEAMRAAFDTEAGDALVADVAQFSDPDANETLYLDETVQVAGTDG